MMINAGDKDMYLQNSSLVLPSSKWTDQTINPGAEIVLCKVEERHILSGSESQFEGSVILTMKN